MYNIPSKSKTDENLIWGTSYKVVLSFQYTTRIRPPLPKVVVQTKEIYMAFTKHLGPEKYSFSSNKQKKEKSKFPIILFYPYSLFA